MLKKVVLCFALNNRHDCLSYSSDAPKHQEEEEAVPFPQCYFRYFWRIHSESCSVFDMWQGEEECKEFFSL